MKSRFARLPAMRLALEPRIVYDAAIAAVVADRETSPFAVPASADRSDPARALAPARDTEVRVADTPASTITVPATVGFSEDGVLQFSAANTISFTSTGVGDHEVYLASQIGGSYVGYISVTAPSDVVVSANGTALVHMTGSVDSLNAALATIEFTAPPDFNGGLVIYVTVITPGAPSADGQQIGVTVAPVADITNDRIHVTPGQTAVFNVLAGTGGATPDSFESTDVVVGNHGSLANPAAGALTVGADGAVHFTPAPGYVGTTSFTYDAGDFHFASGGGYVSDDFETATVTLVVDSPSTNSSPVNRSPATVVTNEDTGFSFTGANKLSVADPDNNVKSAQLTVTHGDVQIDLTGGARISAGASGSSTLTLAGTQTQINAALATVSYEPSADYYGAATLTLATSDGSRSDTDVVNITVTAVPDAVDDSLTTAYQTPVTANVITGTNGASADNFEDGARALTAVSQGADGSVAFAADGSVTYTPHAGFIGHDSFTYTVTAGGVTETARVSVTVSTPAPVPQSPVNTVPAGQDTFEDTALAFTGATAIGVADADSPSVTTTLSVTNGLLQVAAFDGATIVNNGTSTVTIRGSAAAVNGALNGLLFAPLADYNGPALLTIRTSDGTLTDTDTVNISVKAVVDIAADSLVTDQDTAVTANLIAGSNGASADNFEGTPVITAVTQGAHGVVTIAAGGNVTYVPNIGYSGPDRFAYTVTSGTVTESATVAVDVKTVAASSSSAPPAPAPVPAPATLQGPMAEPSMLFASNRDAANAQVGSSDTLHSGNWTFVHRAVHDEPLFLESSLHVQEAVRYSQAESLLLDQRINSANAPEAGSALFDAFGLPAPRTEFVSPVQQATQANDAQASPPGPQRAAISFTSQLRRGGETLRTAADRAPAAPAQHPTPPAQHPTPLAPQAS